MPPVGFSEMKDKFLFWTVTSFLFGAITWAAWVTIKITSDSSTVVYLQNREQKLELVITEHTKAINELRIEIAKLNVANQ